jgi:hypothetical protein
MSRIEELEAEVEKLKQMVASLEAWLAFERARTISAVDRRVDL